MQATYLKSTNFYTNVQLSARNLAIGQYIKLPHKLEKQPQQQQQQQQQRCHISLYKGQLSEKQNKKQAPLPLWKSKKATPIT